MIGFVAFIGVLGFVIVVAAAFIPINTHHGHRAQRAGVEPDQPWLRK